MVQAEGNKTVRRTIEFYNLDVIISVGYRVKSKNGVAFRKWANSVLKEYLLRGYVVDANRALITNENYVNLTNKVESIDARLTKIEEEHISDLEKEGKPMPTYIIHVSQDIDTCSMVETSFPGWLK